MKAEESSFSRSLETLLLSRLSVIWARGFSWAKPALGLTVGVCNGAAGGSLFNGRIVEFARWDAALTGDDLAAAKQYFKDQWLDV